MNLGGQDMFSGAPFMNFLKLYSAQASTLSVGNDPSLRDNNGYPTTTLTINYGGVFYLPSALAPDNQYFTAQWKGSVSSRLKFTINDSVTLVGSCTNGAWSGGTITTLGGDGSCQFHFNSYAAQKVSFYFNSGFANVAGITDLAIVRSGGTGGAIDDLNSASGYNSAACTARYQCFLPEVLAVYRGLGPPKFLRFMGLVPTNNSNEVNKNYRATPQTFTAFGSNFLPQSTYAGASGPTTAGTCTGSGTLLVNNAPDSPVDWTDGEVIQCALGSALTGASTLTIGTRATSKTVVCWDVTALTGCTQAAGNLITMVYDGLLDKVLMKPGGITTNMPIEYAVALANVLGSGLWWNFPAWSNDAYVSFIVQYVHDNLNSSLVAYFEYSNEIWNSQSGFGQTQWATARGQAFGFPTTNGEDVYGWYGFRVRQIMGNLIPAIYGAMPNSRVKRTLMYQGGGSTTPISTYRMKGHDLAPSGVSTGIGNSTYNTWSGGADYTTIPNRPIDVVEVTGFAPYAVGTNYCTGPDVACVPTSANVPFYNQVIAAMDAGQTATAIALVDDDINRGRTLVQNVTCSGTTFSTPLAHGFVSGTRVAFQVTGGTICTGINTAQLYSVTGTSSAGCAGGVTCNFTMQPFVNGAPSGGNVSASAGTGTVTVGASSSRNMQYYANLWDPQWESAVAAFDVDRPVGAAAIEQYAYEGNLEAQGPAPTGTGSCSSLGLTSTSTFTFTANLTNASAVLKGISSTAFYGLQPGMTLSSAHVSGTIVADSTYDPISGTIRMSAAATGTATAETISVSTSSDNACSQLWQAYYAWLNSASAATTTKNFLRQFLGTDPNAANYQAMSHSKAPSWLVLPGYTPWSMTLGGYYLPPFQTYTGFGQSLNFLLKRDLDPASNDNDPMWLGKVG